MRRPGLSEQDWADLRRDAVPIALITFLALGAWFIARSFLGALIMSLVCLVCSLANHATPPRHELHQRKLPP